MIRGYCISCKIQREIQNPRFEKKQTKRRIVNLVKGNCPVCNQNLVAIVSNNFDPRQLESNQPTNYKSPPKEYPTEIPTTLRKLTNEELQKMQDRNIQKHQPVDLDEFRKEDIPVLKHIRDDKTLNKIARENGVPVGDSYKKWFLVAIIFTIIVFGYFIYSGYFQDNISLLCGNMSVENSCPECPSITCPENNCNVNVVCNATSICEVPEELYINLNISNNES